MASDIKKYKYREMASPRLFGISFFYGHPDDLGFALLLDLGRSERMRSFAGSDVFSHDHSLVQERINKITSRRPGFIDVHFAGDANTFYGERAQGRVLYGEYSCSTTGKYG